QIVQPDDSFSNRNPDVIYVPTPQAVVDRMLTLAKVKPGDVVFDLGSGDGRIVITAAQKFNALGIGYEIDPQYVKESRENVKKAGLQGKVLIEQRDMFKLDLSKADVIAVYILPMMMDKLIPQFNKMKPRARIVAHDLAFSNGPAADYKEYINAADDNGNKRDHQIFLWTTPLKTPATEVLEQLPPPKPAPATRVLTK